jgi:phospho-N-acetylmuramoyl-pentapeptide-transferase
MFYYISLYKDFFGPLNVFSYITFRTGGAIVTAFLLSLLFGPVIIKKLKKANINSFAKEEGPKTHLSKNGTPTMGGFIVLISLISSVLLWTKLDCRFIWILLFTAFMLSLAGIYDDYEKISKKDGNGLHSSVKLTIQIITATLVIGYLAVYPPNPDYITSITIPYTKFKAFNLGPVYFVLVTLLIVGSSNAVNLTDGLDGLAIGNLILCALAYAVFAYLAGNANFSHYLKIIHVAGAGEIAVFMGALIGAGLGFLWFNCYPAQVFMGDTSSLFLGGVIGTAAICIKQELILPVVGGIFVIETLSVLIQMGYFKITGGKRFFKMAPLHHHYELKGTSEPKITIRFWIVAVMLTLAALSSIKLR